MRHHTVTVDVDIDIGDIIADIDTETLQEELAERGGGHKTNELYDRLYVAVVTNDAEARDQIIRLLIWEHMGRVLP